VKTAGVDSEAGALAGVTTPLEQLAVTVTLAALLSEKSLLTVNVATALLRMVHVPAASVAWQVFVL
jgi:hypothetical protein